MQSGAVNPTGEGVTGVSPASMSLVIIIIIAAVVLVPWLIMRWRKWSRTVSRSKRVRRPGRINLSGDD